MYLNLNCIIQMQHSPLYTNSVQWIGEPITSYRWTGWSWRLQENYRLFQGIHGIYLTSIKRIIKSQHGTSWTWKRPWSWLTMPRNLPGHCLNGNCLILVAWLTLKCSSNPKWVVTSYFTGVYDPLGGILCGRKGIYTNKLYIYYNLHIYKVIYKYFTGVWWCQ